MVPHQANDCRFILLVFTKATQTSRPIAPRNSVAGLRHFCRTVALDSMLTSRGSIDSRRVSTSISLRRAGGVLDLSFDCDCDSTGAQIYTSTKGRCSPHRLLSTPNELIDNLCKGLSLSLCNGELRLSWLTRSITSSNGVCTPSGASRDVFVSMLFRETVSERNKVDSVVSKEGQSRQDCGFSTSSLRSR